MDPIVGDCQCDILLLCNFLQESEGWSVLLSKLFDIALCLQIPPSDLHRIRLELNIGLKTYFGALHDILTCWRSRFSDDAKVSLLCSVLETCGIGAVADRLRTHYSLQKNKTLTTFLCCPDGFQEFLESEFKVLVICCKEKNLTTLKLQDTSNCIHVSDCVEFANLLCNGNSNQIYSVTHSEQDDNSLTNVLRVTGTKLKSRGVIITDVNFDNAETECSGWAQVTVVKDEFSWDQLSSQCRTAILGKHVKISGKTMTLKEVIKKAGMPLDEVLDEETLTPLLQLDKPNLVNCTLAKLPTTRNWSSWLKYRWLSNPVLEFNADRRYIECGEITYTENDFLNLLRGTTNPTSPVIIGYSARMKHSPLLANLAKRLISEGEVVLYAAFCDVIKSVKNQSESGEPLEEALINTLSEVGTHGTLARVYLKNGFKRGSLASKTNPVNIMWDQFDDIADTELAMAILKTAMYSGLPIRVWLTTSPVLADDVEKCLNAIGHYVRERSFLNMCAASFKWLLKEHTKLDADHFWRSVKPKSKHNKAMAALDK